MGSALLRGGIVDNQGLRRQMRVGAATSAAKITRGEVETKHKFLDRMNEWAGWWTGLAMCFTGYSTSMVGMLSLSFIYVSQDPLL